MVTKLNNTQLENIQQILTLRYSKNLKNDNPALEYTSFKNNKIDNPEKFIETSILQTITKELEKNHKKEGGDELINEYINKFKTTKDGRAVRELDCFPLCYYYKQNKQYSKYHRKLINIYKKFYL